LIARAKNFKLKFDEGLVVWTARRATEFLTRAAIRTSIGLPTTSRLAVQREHDGIENGRLARTRWTGESEQTGFVASAEIDRLLRLKGTEALQGEFVDLHA
jgi:hypothetical protein